jgi:YggT family protein
VEIALKIADRLLVFLGLLILVPVLAGWFPQLRRYSAVKWTTAVYEPMFAAVRLVIPPLAGTLDISPLVVWFAIQGLRRAIAYTLGAIAA